MVKLNNLVKLTDFQNYNGQTIHNYTRFLRTPSSWFHYRIRDETAENWNWLDGDITCAHKTAPSNPYLTSTFQSPFTLKWDEGALHI